VIVVYKLKIYLTKLRMTFL